MKTFQEMSRQELEEMRGELTARFEEIKAEGLKLDMSRGKPAPEQLDTAMPLLNVLNAESDMQAENGTDCRNYGLMDGLPEAKRLIAEMLETKPENVIVDGNASL